MFKILKIALLSTTLATPAMAGYDCYDGKTDDCTLEWSLAHKPRIQREAPASDKQCIGHVSYLDKGVRKTENFEITAMTINQKTGVTLYGGHGTNWYLPSEIRITGRCNYVPQHTPVDSQGDKYYETQ